MYEASINFDMENIAPFLIELESHATLGLPVADLTAFTKSTPVEKERSRALTVTFHGKRVALEYRVFMDDIDAPDIYFFTPSDELAKLIQKQMIEFADRNGL